MKAVSEFMRLSQDLVRVNVRVYRSVALPGIDKQGHRRLRSRGLR